MSYLVESIIPDSEYMGPPIDESDYVEMKYKRRRKFKMPYNLSLQRLKISSSTTTLVDLYSNSRSTSPRKSFHEPREDAFGLKVFDRKNSRRRSSTSSSETFLEPSPFPQFMDDVCRQLLDEKRLELQNKKALTRRPQYIYGDPKAASIPADALKEPCVNYRLYDMSKEEEAALVVRRKIWEEDKARGVHFASFLKVKRRELAALLQKVYGSGIDMQGSTKPHAATAEVRTKCANCTQPKPVVPPGLDPCGFLPLVYHNRAKSCERQRSNPEEAEKARTIAVHRMIQKTLPGLSTWTDRRTKTSHPRRSPLHKSITAAGLLWNAEGCEGEDEEPNDANLTDLGTNCSSVSASAYSGDATSVTHDSSGTVSTASEIMEAHQSKSARTYRVPDFLPAGKESRAVAAVKGKSLKKENKKPKTRPSRLKWKVNVDKPLPPLPLPSPPLPSHPNEHDYPRSLRRSQSEMAILRGRQRAL